MSKGKVQSQAQVAREKVIMALVQEGHTLERQYQLYRRHIADATEVEGIPEKEIRAALSQADHLDLFMDEIGILDEEEPDLTPIDEPHFR